MKRKILLLLFAFASFGNVFSQRICGTDEAEQFVRSNDDKYDLRRQQIENFTNEFIAHGGGVDRSLVTIPVVVHVVWNTTAENISDAQVQSQIDVLNADFRRLNSDVSLVPSAFSSLAADVNIEFCLATVDPNGNPTNGITRTQTATTAFGTNDQVKSSATGGVNAWNTTQYLNMWVCDISGGILGYAQFPGGSASTDGVVVDFQYFGTVGTATAPFNKGRTATHEVGHWLNLRHIWGDDGTGCTGSDLVADTPNAGGPNYGCPAFPKVSCTNGPNGDMFMNYMDYSDDACMYMFTNGQAARMQALFAPGGFRASLLTSQGCGTTGTLCAAPSGLNTSALTASSATLAWTANASAASYNLRYKLTSASTWTTVTGLTTTSFNLTGLATCSTYEWQVQSVCDATNSSIFSGSNNFTTTGCVATYCTSTGGTADEFINRVVFGSINNTSGNNNGYANFTALSTNVNRGAAVTFNGTPGFTATAFNETWRVWIDFNQDLDFDDAGELVYTSANTSAAVTGTITIPTTATLGATRMRVSMKYNAAATACEVFQYGEVEDYTVNILEAISCGVPTGLAVASVTSNSATASWTALSGATSYSFQYKTNAATTWITVNTTSTSVPLSGLVASTTYNTRVAAVCSGVTGAFSAQVNFTTSAAPVACTDNFETNNTSNQAKSITVNTNITARIGTSTDRDWFRFSNTTSQRNIRIDLTNLPADYDVRLINPSGVQVGISQNTGTTNEAIVFNNGPVGTYRVEVYGFNGAFNSTLCYTLRASRSGTSFREGDEYVEEEVIEMVAEEPLAAVNVFPNPTNDNVDVTFDSNEEGNVQITVVDMTGRVIYNTMMPVIRGFNKTSVEMSNFAPGFYTIVLNNGEKNVSTRVLKQ